MRVSTRQRLAAIELGFPPPEVERAVMVHEGGATDEVAGPLTGDALLTAGLAHLVDTHLS